MNKVFSRLNVLSQTNNEFWSSGLACAMQTIISNPFNIIRTRREVIGFTEFKSTFSGLKDIYAK